MDIYEPHGNYKSKITIDPQKIKRKEPKNNNKKKKPSNHKARDEERDRRTTKPTRKQLTKGQ